MVTPFDIIHKTPLNNQWSRMAITNFFYEGIIFARFQYVILLLKLILTDGPPGHLVVREWQFLITTDIKLCQDMATFTLPMDIP